MVGNYKSILIGHFFFLFFLFLLKSSFSMIGDYQLLVYNDNKVLFLGSDNVGDLEMGDDNLSDENYSSEELEQSSTEVNDLDLSDDENNDSTNYYDDTEIDEESAEIDSSDQDITKDEGQILENPKTSGFYVSIVIFILIITFFVIVYLGKRIKVV